MINRKTELLTILQEESAEVIQAVSKCFRFGETDRNLDSLENEIGDFLGVIKLLMIEGYLNPEHLENAGDAKIKKLEKYMINKKD